MTESTALFRQLLVIASLIVLAGCGAPSTTQPRVAHEILVQAVTPAFVTPATDQMAKAQSVLEERLRVLNVSGAAVEAHGSMQLAIELPADVDPISMTLTLTPRGFLELIDPQGRSLVSHTAVRTSANPDPIVEAVVGTTPTPVRGPIYPTIATAVGADNIRVQPQRSSIPLTGVYVHLAPDAAHAVNTFSQGHIGKQLCIVVDNVVWSCPTLQSELRGDQIEVLAPAALEAMRLAIALRAGPLPFPLAVVPDSRS